MSLDPKNPIYKCSNCDWSGTYNQVIFVKDKGLWCPKCTSTLDGKRKKMLFVDDRSKRIHYALNNFPEYEVTIATCVPEALRALCSQEWDVVSLDYDLNGHDFQDQDSKDCGMEIVRYMEQFGGWPRDLHMLPVPEFRVHSKNLFAANTMILRMKNMGLRCYYSPITYPVENMKYDEKGIPK